MPVIYKKFTKEMQYFPKKYRHRTFISIKEQNFVMELIGRGGENMIRTDIIEMSTKRFADYIRKITGGYRSPSPTAVANDCRAGKLDCYQEVPGGDYRIIVKPMVVPVEEYNELKAKYEALKNAMVSIKKLAET